MNNKEENSFIENWYNSLFEDEFYYKNKFNKLKIKEIKDGISVVKETFSFINNSLYLSRNPDFNSADFSSNNYKNRLSRDIDVQYVLDNILKSMGVDKSNITVEFEQNKNMEKYSYSDQKSSVLCSFEEKDKIIFLEVIRVNDSYSDSDMGAHCFFYMFETPKENYKSTLEKIISQYLENECNQLGVLNDFISSAKNNKEIFHEQIDKFVKENCPNLFMFLEKGVIEESLNKNKLSKSKKTNKTVKPRI
jgi:hypothetical protein